MEENPKKPRSRRPWLKFAVLGVLVVVILLVAFAPAIAAPIVRSFATSAIEERTGGRATIDSLSLSWKGKVELGGVDVAESGGAPIARLDAASAKIDVMGALKGRYDFDVLLQGFELHLRQRPDGTWNVAEWMPPKEPEATEEPPEDEQPEEPISAPRGAVKLANGRILVEALDGTTAIEGLELEAHLEPPGETSTWKAGFSATRDGRAAGSFLSEGVLERADTSLDPASLRANGKLAIDGLPLVLLEPFLSAGPSPLHVRGDLDAEVSLTGTADRGRFEGEVNATELTLHREAAPGARALDLEEPKATLAFAADVDMVRLDVALEKIAFESNLARGSLSGKLENLAALNAMNATSEPNSGSAFHVRDLKGELWYRPEKLDALLGTTLAQTLSSAAEEHVGFDLEAHLEPPGTPSTWKAALTSTQGGKPAGSLRSDGTLDRKGAGWDPKELSANGSIVVERFPLALIQPFLASPTAPTELSGTLDARVGIEGDAKRSNLSGNVDVRDLAFRRVGSAETQPFELVEPSLGLTFAAGLDTERLDVDLASMALQSSLAHGSLSGKLENLRALTEEKPRSSFRVRDLQGEFVYRPERVSALFGAALPAGLESSAEESLRLELDANLEPPGTSSTWKALLTATQGGKPAGTLRSDGTLERKSAAWNPTELQANANLALEDFPLALAEPFLESQPTSSAGSTRLSGALDLQAHLTGNAQEAKLEGRASVHELALRLASADPAKVRALIEPEVMLVFASKLDTKELDVELDKLEIQSDLLRGSVSGKLENLRALAAPTAPGAESALRIQDLEGELRYRPEKLDALLGTTLARTLSSAAEELVGFELEAELGPPGKTSTWKALVTATQGGEKAGTFRSEGSLERKSAGWDPDELTANGKLAVERFPLAMLQPFMTASMETAGAAPELAGDLDADLSLSGDARSARLSGDINLRELVLHVAGAPESKPIEVREPSITVSLALDVTTERLDVGLENLALESQLLRGTLKGRFENLRGLIEPAPEPPEREPCRVSGLKGDFRYVPDRIGALLGPWLPVALSGAEEQLFVIELDGNLPVPKSSALPTAEPAAPPSSSFSESISELKGSVTLGLGGFETTGIAGTGGELTATLADGGARWNANADANGGKLLLEGSTVIASLFDAQAESQTSFSMKAQEVGANSQLAPLLSTLHPAFAAVDTLKGAEISGLVNCALELGYDGPLAGPAISSWEAFPKQRLQGKGTFSISSAKIQGSPFLGEVLGLFGVDMTKELTPRPLEFQIQNGRVSYVNPWTWTISGAETTFTGSVGLDKTLALSWNVPVTDSLVKKYAFLEFVRGQTIEVPIGGTVTRPKLELDETLKSLALQAAQKGLLEKLGGEIGGGDDGAGDLGDVLGIGKKPEAEDPAKLLADADKLWDQGKKAEAAAIYRKIREEHKVSLVYTLNRDRIKKRAEYKP